MASTHIGSHLIDLWIKDKRRCAVFNVGRTLELRIYDGDELVALAPCKGGAEALEMSKAWFENPPIWPPFN